MQTPHQKLSPQLGTHAVFFPVLRQPVRSQRLEALLRVVTHSFQSLRVLFFSSFRDNGNRKEGEGELKDSTEGGICLHKVDNLQISLSEFSSHSQLSFFKTILSLPETGTY